MNHPSFPSTSERPWTNEGWVLPRFVPSARLPLLTGRRLLLGPDFGAQRLEAFLAEVLLELSCVHALDILAQESRVCGKWTAFEAETMFPVRKKWSGRESARHQRHGPDGAGCLGAGTPAAVRGRYCGISGDTRPLALNDKSTKYFDGNLQRV